MGAGLASVFSMLSSMLRPAAEKPAPAALVRMPVLPLTVVARSPEIVSVLPSTEKPTS